MRKTLVVVTRELVSSPDEIAQIKQKYAKDDLHQQLIERLEENAVTLPGNFFDQIVVYETPGSAACDRLYKALKPAGILYGTKDSKMVLSGFVPSGENWTKLDEQAAITMDRKLPNKNKKSPFKRLPNLDSLAMDSELIDEDDLVLDSQPAFKFPAKCDPGPGRKRRKACKDCTCGLKEMEEQEIADADARRVVLDVNDMAEIDFTVPGKAVGGCGSCALGDAFRCDGCPYLGLPPFKPGEVVSIEQFGDDF